MKKSLKGSLSLIGIVFLIVAVLYGSFLYITKYKITDVGAETSIDGRYKVVFQQIGEPDFPFGATQIRILVKRENGTLVDKKETSIYDDGAMLREANWEVFFYPAGVKIVIKGREQEDTAYIVYYDTTTPFNGYSKKQIITAIEDRYGKEVSFVGELAGEYVFNAGEFMFQVTNDFQLTDNYEEKLIYHMGEEFSKSHNRYVTFVKKEEVAEKYIPVISFNGRQAMEIEAFCSGVCDFIEFASKEPYFATESEFFSEIMYYVEDEEEVFSLDGYLEPYDRNNLYNALYVHVESISIAEYNNNFAEEDTSQKEEQKVSDEIWEFYLSIEPDCSYTMKDGTDYKMIGVDRACGSSYYSLISMAADGITKSVVNSDPYAGSGGQSMWLTFLEDENIGFSCLAYSGGAYGALYRTGDGGKTFVQVEYPSAQAHLPDKTIYNPFVMPEEVYAKGDELYLVVGQGPSGDYYGEKGYCNGLYKSEDKGKSWEYLGEEAVPVKE